MNTNTLRALWDITGEALIQAAAQQPAPKPPGTTNETWLLVGFIAWALIALYYFTRPTIQRWLDIRNQALRRWQAIDELRGPDGSGHSVTICADHDEEQAAVIDCLTEWTGWEDKSFHGATLDDCLKEAILAKRTWDRASSMREYLTQTFPAVRLCPEHKVAFSACGCFPWCPHCRSYHSPNPAHWDALKCKAPRSRCDLCGELAHLHPHTGCTVGNAEPNDIPFDTCKVCGGSISDLHPHTTCKAEAVAKQVGAFKGAA